MTADRRFRVVLAALFAAGLAGIVIDFAVLRPRMEERLRFSMVIEGPAMTLRTAPDRHADPLGTLGEGVVLHPTAKRRNGFVFVVADPTLSGWVAEEDWRERTRPCRRP
ncbi:MAG: hypothetical protein MUE73_07295 [Planctomycetes bacterium]|jgi:hypothetical protein|nr:hypothetical protein [Planctomycetota bacterium]